jgi:hypothetical protein
MIVYPRRNGLDNDLDSGQGTLDFALHAVNFGLETFLQFLEFGC